MKKLRLLYKGILGSMIYTLLLTGTACSKDEPVSEEEQEVIEEEKEEPETNSFVGPTYKDDYTSIASWSERSQWNLANVHDPTVVKDGEYYYMYQTDASYGNAHEGHGHYPYRRSKDLINWEFKGAVFPEAPSWIKDSLNSMRADMDPSLPPIENPNYGFWAPHVTKVDDKFRLYYSVVVTNPIIGNDPNSSWTERAFIGLAESNDLSSGNWEDKGMVISSIADGEETYLRDNGNDWSGYFKFNAIDPSFVVTPEGEQWLIYGSWHSGISAVQVDPSTGKPSKLEALEDYGVRIAGRGNVGSNRWQGLEAPEIIYNQETGFYYLFQAYDELSVAYNTRVVRSQNITGPYYGIDGGNVTEGAEAYPILTHPYKFDGHTGWVGISHPSVFQNPDTGKWFYSSQGRLPENVAGINVSNAVMMGQIREIYWTQDGWPLVAPERYAGVPDTEITKAEIVGTWEGITLEYQYRSMQTSYDVIFRADNSLGGGLDGTWSLDADSGILTINGNDFIVDTAWDWEASPREETLTYAGIASSGASIWGKKVD
ncbi:arabinan endo-1,5-alpha-L-arabinosidase [Christiangramia forsetii]|uniref:Arabinan endo-1,5-alpha-L-arabinosidase n=2 Tax=Christiangramia forsetii TaxID=411153 RepID=A0LZ73_CHRFK|nr:arabinan endo-1,5-alpha-L-arabinosidase [Christiangramia forsetii]GGG37620.1 arabinan endo-1,5-alpha-L-arabinosidase [Christiangramia forsetii]CAL65668.1 arabinan endo-1,5-alpha-L-arabinosidase [Christiangramia forsetii KT0803]